MGLIRTLAGLGAGAGMMYYLDPDRGRRRRARTRDKMISLGHHLGRAIQKGLRDAGNRAQGLAAAIHAGGRSAQVAADKTLVARVRSRIGRAVTHPRAIHVTAEAGRVTLQGHVLRDEMNNLITTVEETQGVRQVVNQVEAHGRGENFAALQGARENNPEATWPPAVRLLAGATGGGLAVYSIAKRDAVSLTAGIVGLGLIARATTNKDLSKLLVQGGTRKMVNICKVIHLDVPIDEVYEFWSNYENFPRFMRHVREVTGIDDRRSRWVVSGPAGAPVSWDAEITAQVQGQLLAWRTLPGSVIDHSGMVRFESAGVGTDVTVRMSYYPPAGTVGHLLASLFGSSPKRELDEDLMRMKALLEQGRVRGVSLDEMEGVRGVDPEPGW